MYYERYLGVNKHFLTLMRLMSPIWPRDRFVFELPPSMCFRSHGPFTCMNNILCLNYWDDVYDESSPTWVSGRCWIMGMGRPSGLDLTRNPRDTSKGCVS